MPNADKKNQGMTLKQRLQTAADMTAQERAGQEAAKDGAKKKSITKRRASKELPAASAQDAKESPEKSEETKKPKKRRSPKFAARMRVVAVVVVVLIALGAVLYPAARDYYKSYRQEQQLQAALDAINERNDEIESQNDALGTDEGVEAQAREELGWVTEGENAAIVTNIEDGDDTTGKLPSQVDTSTIEPPHTWYYDILDVIFFVNL